MRSTPTAIARLFSKRSQLLCVSVGLTFLMMFAIGQIAQAGAAERLADTAAAKKASGKSKKCGVKTVNVVTDLESPVDEEEPLPDEGDADDGETFDPESLFGLADLISEPSAMRVSSKGIGCSRAVRVVRQYFADPARNAGKRYGGYRCTEGDFDVICKRGKKRATAIEA